MNRDSVSVIDGWSCLGLMEHRGSLELLERCSGLLKLRRRRKGLELSRGRSTLSCDRREGGSSCSATNVLKGASSKGAEEASFVRLDGHVELANLQALA